MPESLNAPSYDPISDFEISQKIGEKIWRLVRNCWKREPGIVTNKLNNLDWPSLQTRRKQVRLIMFHKTIHGESQMELPNKIKRKNW